MKDGKTVVITGASAGLGRAAAQAFARRGWRVGAVARGQERLQETCREVEELGGQAVWVAADVSDADALDRAAEIFEQRLGPIDVWVNSAMVTVFSPVAEMSPAEFQRVVNVTLMGQVHGTMTALKRMRRRNRGTIVQVGSALAWRAIPLQSAYCAAKHGVRAFTDSLRSELLHEGSKIRLTMVQMPAVNTPQFDWARNRMPHKVQPMPPIFQPEVAAGAIVRAAETAPRELWVGRSSITAILGNLFFPSYVDRLLAKSGFSGQQTDEPAQQNRADNLYGPVSEPFGAHGRFDRRAQSWAVTVRQNTAERFMVAGAATLLASALVLGGVQLRRRLAAR